jgi:flagellar protein FlbD
VHIRNTGGLMIKLTGLNKKEFILNAEIIEKIEVVPETLITLVNGKKYLVLESAEEVIDKVLRYKRKIFTGEL